MAAEQLPSKEEQWLYQQKEEERKISKSELLFGTQNWIYQNPNSISIIKIKDQDVRNTRSNFRVDPMVNKSGNTIWRLLVGEEKLLQETPFSSLVESSLKALSSMMNISQRWIIVSNLDLCDPVVIIFDLKGFSTLNLVLFIFSTFRFSILPS